MIESIRKIFTFVQKIIIWIQKSCVIGEYNIRHSALILGCLMAVFVVEERYLNILFLNNFIVGIIGAYLFFIVLLGIFVLDKIPKFLSKGNYTTKEFLEIFSHSSFLYGLIVFSILASVYISVMVIYIGFALTGKINSALLNYLIEIFYFISTAFTIIWFSFHIVSETVQIKAIKVRLRFYLAIASSLSFLIILPAFEELFKTMITTLGIAFSWISYLIEEKEYEEFKMTSITKGQ